MRPERADAGSLWDMLQYACGVVDAVRNVSFEQYLADENLRLAIERRIEIIGEAARRVSPAFQEAHPEIPWRSVVGQRHALAHEYGEIDHERVWRVAVVHAPRLIAMLQPLVSTPPPDPEA